MRPIAFILISLLAGSPSLVLALATPAAAQPAPRLAWSAAEIERLAGTPFFEGVPLDLVQSFPPDVALPVLRRLLNDPARAETWPNAAAMLGMIGEDSDAALLSTVARRAAVGDPGTAARARSSAIMGLGYLANARGSRAALQELSGGLDPSVWQVRGLSAADADQAAIVSALGLGLAGRPDAQRQLARAARRPFFQSGAGAEVLREATTASSAVARQGLLEYYGLQQRPTLLRFRPGQLDLVVPADNRPVSLQAEPPRDFQTIEVAVPGPAGVLPTPVPARQPPTPAVIGTIPNPVTIPQ
jgi:hypothetical protein